MINLQGESEGLLAIRKRGNSWQIDVLIPTGKKDEDGKEIRKREGRTFTKKKDAEAEHDKIKTLCREKRFLDVKEEYRTTLKDLVDRYHENFETQPSYEKSKQFSLENIKDHFGEKTLM